MITDEYFKWTKFAERDDLGTPIGIKKDAPEWAKKNYQEYLKNVKALEEKGIDV